MKLTLTQLVIWILRILAAVIMIQTLYFKFSGSEESVYIFTTIGMEPWGRIATGIMELIASILILYPRTTGLGSLMGMGLMSGALFFHFTKLGFEIKADGGQLFIYALVVFISCTFLALIHKKEIVQLVHKLMKRI